MSKKKIIWSETEPVEAGFEKFKSKPKKKNNGANNGNTKPGNRSPK